jgi:peptidyl-prolyl cis-trans isomerase SurA
MTPRMPWTSTIAAALVAAALTLPCARAQQGNSGVGAPSNTPQTTAAPQASPQAAPQTSPQTPAKVNTQADRESGLQIKSTPGNPREEKPGKQVGGLTFLPELKPTDGVAQLPQQLSASMKPDEAADAHATLLDRAAAVIDGEVILDSDIREQEHFAVFEPVRVPGGKYTPLEAMQQIVNRTLLLHQMREQKLVLPPSDAAVDEELNLLRRHMPACEGYNCETEEGWHRFLAAQGFTEAALHERWKSRMQILNFVNVRFRNGIRIAKPEIEKYYQNQLVPEFTARKLPPPPLALVSDRIDEVLLQQHVNVLLTDYLRSLKDAGNVQILDPAYNQLGNAAAASNNQNPEQTPPAPDRTGGEQ